MSTKNIQMFKLDLEKGRGIREEIANTHRIVEKAREFQKTSTFAVLTIPKPLTM